ncbi:MAG: hypothetical protein J5966_10490 [Lachnospiraceae bacterium]|nr:hypothetical protein [Lachnospiraceae bacterium]
MLLVDGKAEAHGENRLDEEKLHNEFHELPQDRVIINVVYLSIADLRKDELQQQFVQNILKMTSSFCSSRINFKNGTTFLTLPQHIIVRGKIIRDIQPDLLIKAIRILPSPILQEKHVFKILDKANFFTGNTQAPILCEQIIFGLQSMEYLSSEFAEFFKEGQISWRINKGIGR